MDPVTLGIAALPSLFQGIYGITQQVNAQKTLNGLTRPEYKKPEDIGVALTLAQQAYGAASQQEVQRNIQNDVSAANSVNAATNAGYGAQAAPRIEAQRQAGVRENSVLAEQQQAADMQRLMGALQVNADYKDQEFQINEFAPYSEKYNEARQQAGAGMANINTGLTGISSLAQLYSSNMSKGAVTPTQAAGVTAPAVQQSQSTGSAVQNFGQAPDFQTWNMMRMLNNINNRPR